MFFVNFNHKTLCSQSFTLDTSREDEFSANFRVNGRNGQDDEEAVDNHSTRVGIRDEGQAQEVKVNRTVRGTIHTVFWGGGGGGARKFIFLDVKFVRKRKGRKIQANLSLETPAT